MKGPTESGLGAAIAVLDDVDDNGYAEVVVADPLADAIDGTPHGGVVYVVDWADFTDGAMIADKKMFSLQADTGARFLRVNRRMGDHDRNGKADLSVASPWNYDVYTAASGLFLSGGDGSVRVFSDAAVAAGGSGKWADAAVEFAEPLDGSTFGLAYDVGRLDAGESTDIAIGAPLYGYGKLFLFISEM